MRFPPASRLSTAMGLFVLVTLCGCHVHHTSKSPGPDFTFDAPISLSPAEPGSSQSTTVTFSVTGYSNASYANVRYIAYLDNNIQLLVASGVIPLIPGLASSGPISFTAFPNYPGLHTITVYVDPGNALGSQDTENNLESVLVTYADFDLAFSGAPTASPGSPTTADSISINFNVENSDTSGNGTAATNVSYQILESTGTPDSGVIPITGQATNILVSGVIPVIPANTSVPISALLPAVTAGVHEYTIVINGIDPLPEQDPTNDNLSIGVTVAPVVTN